MHIIIIIVLKPAYSFPLLYISSVNPSGISLWELEVDRSSKYNAMQTNFHTFSVSGKTYAIQFAK